MIRRLVRNKKLHRWLVAGSYPIAIDGTQKAVRRDLLSPEWLQRRINAGTDNEYTQYYVYVLEAHLAFANGLTLPLLSEFLNYAEGDTSHDKQDCETRAFHRIAHRLKAAFPRLPIMLLLDGLYPNGPVIQACRRNHWQFMIVLKDESLPSVWEEYEGLRKLDPGQEVCMTWGNRRQRYTWVNDIEYRYGSNRGEKQIVHVVVCEERWNEIDEHGDTVEKASRHAWLSSKRLSKGNLHQRCNLGAVPARPLSLPLNSKPDCPPPQSTLGIPGWSFGPGLDLAERRHLHQKKETGLQTEQSNQIFLHSAGLGLPFLIF